MNLFDLACGRMLIAKMTSQVLLIDPMRADVALLHLDGVHLASLDVLLASEGLAEVAPLTTPNVLPQALGTAEVGPVALRTNNLEEMTSSYRYLILQQAFIGLFLCIIATKKEIKRFEFTTAINYLSFLEVQRTW